MLYKRTCIICKKKFNTQAKKKSTKEAARLAARAKMAALALPSLSNVFDIDNWDADRPAVREALEWGGLGKITFYKG